MLDGWMERRILCKMTIFFFVFLLFFCVGFITIVIPSLFFFVSGKQRMASMNAQLHARLQSTETELQSMRQAFDDPTQLLARCEQLCKGRFLDETDKCNLAETALRDKSKNTAIDLSSFDIKQLYVPGIIRQ